MKEKCTIGFITTLSGRWPPELPEERHSEYSAWLLDNIDANIEIYDKVAVNAADVQEAIRQFRASGVDIVIQLHGAFTGDDICCMIADELRVPILLWAPHEPPFQRDERLYANALVSVTMNSAALKRNGYRCDYLYGDKEELHVHQKLNLLVKTFSAIRSLRKTFLGLFGYRPTAFYNCAFDESLIRRIFGIRMESVDLKVVFDRMERLEPLSVQTDMDALSEEFDPSALPEHHLENHSRLHIALKQIMAEQGFDFATIKCWPEMGALKTTPCAVLGRLADEGFHIICEGDVDAGITLILQNYLTGLPCFITDMINLDEQQNTMTFWHCGNAAPSLVDRSDGLTLNNHPLAGQGTAFYGALKEGDVTVARFCNIDGTYKLFLMRGKAIKSSRNTRGMMVNVCPDRPVHEVLDFIMQNGVAHHYSIVWQDVAEEMKAVCNLLGIEVWEL